MCHTLTKDGLTCDGSSRLLHSKSHKEMHFLLPASSISWCLHTSLLLWPSMSPPYNESGAGPVFTGDVTCWGLHRLAIEESGLESEISAWLLWKSLITQGTVLLTWKGKEGSKEKRLVPPHRRKIQGEKSQRQGERVDVLQLCHHFLSNPCKPLCCPPGRNRRMLQLGGAVFQFKSSPVYTCWWVLQSKTLG